MKTREGVGRSKREEPMGTGMLDIVRCPKCRGPLVARVGRSGPYFHCLCVGDAEAAAVVGGVKVPKMARQAG